MKENEKNAMIKGVVVGAVACGVIALANKKGVKKKEKREKNKKKDKRYLIESSAANDIIEAFEEYIDDNYGTSLEKALCDEDKATIYGEDYYNLESRIIDILIEKDIIKEED